MFEILPAKIPFENLGRFNVTRKDQFLVLLLGLLCTLVQYTRIYFVPYSMSAQLVSSCGSTYDYKNCNLTILKSIKGYLLGGISVIHKRAGAFVLRKSLHHL